MLFKKEHTSERDFPKRKKRELVKSKNYKCELEKVTFGSELEDKCTSFSGRDLKKRLELCFNASATAERWTFLGCSSVSVETVGSLR